MPPCEDLIQVPLVAAVVHFEFIDVVHQQLEISIWRYKRIRRNLSRNVRTCISCDKPTFYIQLSPYDFVLDIEGMGKVLKIMEEGSKLTVNWYAYIITSDGYLKSDTP
ncbi:unnamed protein product [Lactuca virosa]|uniref:Uncharacterized protein n=1 Tax=Lactuca virosa TaxID=75947 RepID=A0AAU9P1Q8_9ASTR|nr:unnamed protein product [Lactuca virosa]